jgi:hypothetical protein
VYMDKMICVKNVALFLMILSFIFSFFIVSALMSPGSYFLLWDMFNQGFLYYYYVGACLLILFIFSWIFVNKEVDDRDESFDFAIWITFLTIGLIALGLLITWVMIFKVGDTVVKLMNKEIGF